jgi:hypothetical protein
MMACLTSAEVIKVRDTVMLASWLGVYPPHKLNGHSRPHFFNLSDAAGDSL